MALRTAASASGVTFGESLMTRETVDRETPATFATCSSVGALPCWSGVIPASSWPGSARTSYEARVRVAAAISANRRLVIHIDDPEPLLASPRPLEVVHERPGEVAAHVCTLVDGLGDRLEVALEEVDPLRIVHLPVGGDHVIPRRTVLGDVERRQ